ncbi:MAG: P-loop NTPase fold protein [Rikenellaceae bacterium]
MKYTSRSKKTCYLLLAIIACFILSIIAFSNTYVGLLNHLLVNPIASKLSNIIFPITIGVLIIAYYLIFALKERAIYTKRMALAVIIAVLHILAVKSNQWEYYTIGNSTCLMYGNVILFPLICEIVLYIYRMILKHKEYIIQVTKNIKSVFDVKQDLNDSDNFFEYESCHANNDSYKRSDFFDEVSEKLRKAFFFEGSFALGITGKWGSGKSTMLMELVKDVKADNNIDICFEFNPWSCDNADQIVSNFITTYKDQVKQYIPDLSDNIDSYAKLLIGSIDNTFTLSGILQNTSSILFNNTQTLQSQYKIISSRLKKSQVRCIIFIDDIDRLNHNEIMAILRLIRNTANFPNTVFVVAYDKEYVTSTMQNNNIINPASYLDKIFNLEIQLPKYEEYAICNELLDRFAAYFKFDKNSKESNKYRIFIEKSITGKDDTENTFYLVPKILVTNRDVIRFFNSFKLIWEITKKRDIFIVIEDLFYIELLRYKFKPLYDIIRDNPNSILSRETNSFEGYEFYTCCKIAISATNEPKFTPEYELHLSLNEILKDYTQTEIMLAEYIMDHVLFPLHGMGIDNISSVVAISRYFSFQFDDKSLPMVEFNQIVNTPLDKYGDYISPKLSTWLKDKNNVELISHLRNLLNSGNTVILWAYKLFVMMLQDSNDNIVRLSANILNSYVYHLEYKSDEQFSALLKLWDETLLIESKYLQRTHNSSIMLGLICADNLSVHLFKKIGDNEKRLIADFFTSAKSKDKLKGLLTTVASQIDNSSLIEPVSTLEGYLK